MCICVLLPSKKPTWKVENHLFILMWCSEALRINIFDVFSVRRKILPWIAIHIWAINISPFSTFIFKLTYVFRTRITLVFYFSTVVIVLFVYVRGTITVFLQRLHHLPVLQNQSSLWSSYNTTHLTAKQQMLGGFFNAQWKVPKLT